MGVVCVVCVGVCVCLHFVFVVVVVVVHTGTSCGFNLGAQCRLLLAAARELRLSCLQLSCSIMDHEIPTNDRADFFNNIYH